jgi:hypothetical protein
MLPNHYLNIVNILEWFPNVQMQHRENKQHKMDIYEMYSINVDELGVLKKKKKKKIKNNELNKT